MADKRSRVGRCPRATLGHLPNNVESIAAKICHDLVRRYLRHNLLGEAVPVCEDHKCRKHDPVATREKSSVRGEKRDGCDSHKT